VLFMPLEIRIESSGMIHHLLLPGFRVPRLLAGICSAVKSGVTWISKDPITMSATPPPLDDQIRLNWCISRARAALIAFQSCQKGGAMTDDYREEWLSQMQTELVLPVNLRLAFLSCSFFRNMLRILLDNLVFKRIIFIYPLFSNYCLGQCMTGIGMTFWNWMASLFHRILQDQLNITGIPGGMVNWLIRMPLCRRTYNDFTIK